MSNSVTIQLSRPVKVNGVEVTELTMREPLVLDQLAAAELGGSAAMQEINMAANLCDVTPDVLKSMPLKDYSKINKALVGFIG